MSAIIGFYVIHMKKRLKKLTTILMAFFVFLSIGFNVHAGNYSIQASDLPINIITTDSFNQLFYSTKAQQIPTQTLESEIKTVNYSYTLIPYSDNNSLASVFLNFTLNIGLECYPITATGIVDSYALEPSNILWEGLVRGDVIIGDTECKVLVGFSKLDISDEIKACVTLQSCADSNDFDPISFAFGELTINSEIEQEIESNTVAENSTMLQPYGPVVPDGAFTLKSTATASFTNNIYSGTAQRARAYFESANNRLAISVKSYTNNLDNYYSQYESSTESYTITVKSFSIALKRSGSSTYIAGVEYFDFDNGKLGSSAYLKPLFEDAMSLIGIPTSTISATLDSLYGTTTTSLNTNLTKVSVSFGTNQLANFDNATNGIPIVFQMAKSSSTSNSGTYQYTTEMTYRVKYTAPVHGTSYFYVDANDATNTINITLK